MTKIQINWQRICLQLRAKYKPLAVIAKEVGSCERHMNRLARGDVSEPRYTVGVKLLALHESVMSLHAITELHARRWKAAA